MNNKEIIEEQLAQGRDALELKGQDISNPYFNVANKCNDALQTLGSFELLSEDEKVKVRKNIEKLLINIEILLTN